MKLIESWEVSPAVVGDDDVILMKKKIKKD